MKKIWKKIKELEKNKEFMDKIAGMDNLADVAKALNEEGIEITEEELKKAGELYETQGREITEDQLENVSGGRVSIWNIIGRLPRIIGGPIRPWRY